MKIAASCSKEALTGLNAKELLFVFFETDNGKINSVSETSFLAGTVEQCADFLVKNEVDLLLVPSIGDDEKTMLDNAGIHIIDKLRGSVRTLVEAYLAGVLFDNPKFFEN